MSKICEICNNKGKVNLRFAWLLDQLEARMPEAKTKLSAQPPEILLLQAFDEFTAKVRKETLEEVIAIAEDCEGSIHVGTLQRMVKEGERR